MMNISPTEAEEALAAIQAMMKKTRRAISSSGAYLFLIVWGVVWLLGFLGSQYLRADLGGYAWIILDTLGGIISAVIGVGMGRGVRSTSPGISGKRIGIFWLLTIIYCIAAVAVAWPTDGKQMTMFIILFIMLGWVAMGLLLSFVSVWWGLHHHRPGAGRLLPAARHFLSVDGDPGRRRDDRPRPVHPLQVVSHGRVERNHPPAGAPAHHGCPGRPWSRATKWTSPTCATCWRSPTATWAPTCANWKRPATSPSTKSSSNASRAPTSPPPPRDARSSRNTWQHWNRS